MIYFRQHARKEAHVIETLGLSEVDHGLNDLHYERPPCIQDQLLVCKPAVHVINLTCNTRPA